MPLWPPRRRFYSSRGARPRSDGRNPCPCPISPGDSRSARAQPLEPRTGHDLVGRRVDRRGLVRAIPGTSVTRQKERPGPWNGVRQGVDRPVGKAIGDTVGQAGPRAAAVASQSTRRGAARGQDRESQREQQQTWRERLVTSHGQDSSGRMGACVTVRATPTEQAYHMVEAQDGRDRAQKRAAWSGCAGRTRPDRRPGLRGWGPPVSSENDPPGTGTFRPKPLFPLGRARGRLP